MLELPLFPLNSVLFPGTLIHLHIFEERYKEMISLCLDSKQPFGVVLIAEGTEAFGSAKPHMIGCTARIARVQPLEHGRMDITAVGQERFEIQSLHYEHPYLTGLVEMRPIERGNMRTLIRAVEQLRPPVMRYLDILSRVENVQFQLPDWPNDPVAFAYLAAGILQQVPQTSKQALLASNKAVQLLGRIQGLYQFEVTLLEMMVARSEEPGEDLLNTFFSDN
ncbi:MAG: LON peptidase substrate-binding domain-containing protein [Anaerolineae bacterium]|nr:LON peptidase substrate-binding domain-containing protein [Anaerolineae bacterium]